MRKLFVRAGFIPVSGISKNFKTKELEVGLSVWDAVEINGVVSVLLPVTHPDLYIICCDTMVLADRPLFEVTGEVIGEGSIGEPLLANSSIVKLLSDPDIDILPKYNDYKWQMIYTGKLDII